MDWIFYLFLLKKKKRKLIQWIFRKEQWKMKSNNDVISCILGVNIGVQINTLIIICWTQKHSIFRNLVCPFEKWKCIYQIRFRWFIDVSHEYLVATDWLLIYVIFIINCQHEIEWWILSVQTNHTAYPNMFEMLIHHNRILVNDWREHVGFPGFIII